MQHFFEKLVSLSYKGLSFLNGALGDKLASSPLGIEMGFYHAHQKLLLKPAYLRDYYGKHFELRPKVCILVHGLTHNETAWNFDDYSNYGSKLAHDLGYTPFYLRYNTGLHISDNGKMLNTLLASLHANYPIPISEISIIAHSMGGLLTHSACHYGLETSSAWVPKLKHVCLLATPHLGSFLERFANLTTGILARVPNWHTRLVGKAINLRSAGIKDLRFGYLKEEDWYGHNPDSFWHNTQTAVQIPAHVRYYIVSGSLTEDEKHWLNLLFGDVLVSSKSAKGAYNPELGIAFAPNNYRDFPGANHFKLLAMDEVYMQIKEWFEQAQ
ncbi:MAG: alpha/beta fold hydrolase [Bernardetiaceae bacterium]|nr:alpha/beta fold hydrolase [Bernardetiaceae bacterium]